MDRSNVEEGSSEVEQWKEKDGEESGYMSRQKRTRQTIYGSTEKET